MRPDLRLLPLSAATAVAFAEMSQAAAEHVSRWMTGHAPATPDEVDAFVARWQREAQAGTGFGYVLADDERALGFGFLNRIHPRHRFCNLGYWVRPDAAGRGVATEAVRRLAEDGFGRLGLVRVEILMDPDNAASRRVAEKAGAVFEGRLRRRLVSRGGVYDALLYSLVPSDLGDGQNA